MIGGGGIIRDLRVRVVYGEVSGMRGKVQDWWRAKNIIKKKVSWYIDIGVIEHDWSYDN
jgi:hypothetical protein